MHEIGFSGSKQAYKLRREKERMKASSGRGSTRLATGGEEMRGERHEGRGKKFVQLGRSSGASVDLLRDRKKRGLSGAHGGGRGACNPPSFGRRVSACWGSQFEEKRCQVLWGI